MKSAVLDLDFDIDIDPFDWSTVAPSHQNASAFDCRAPEPVGTLQHWYDLGFIGVVQAGTLFPSGYESTTTCELMAFWMGERDAATGIPRQALV